MTIFLTQEEADVLLRMEKVQADSKTRKFPNSGGKCEVPLISSVGIGREHFLLDIYRGRIGVKTTLQTRGRKVVRLARLDFGGAPHRNPDGREIAAPHLHLYREGYEDKWAYPLSPAHFSGNGDKRTLLEEFLQYCNIAKISIQWGMYG